MASIPERTSPFMSYIPNHESVRLRLGIHIKNETDSDITVQVYQKEKRWHLLIMGPHQRGWILCARLSGPSSGNYLTASS